MWLIAPAAEVHQSGEQLSDPATAPDPANPRAPFFPASLPGSLLGALVENGQCPNPYVGLNSRAIPDIGQVGAEAYSAWVVCSFKLSSFFEDSDGHWFLELMANYSLAAFLNGKPVAPDPRGNKGMFLRRMLNLSPLIRTDKNCMALLVSPPDHPGVCDGSSSTQGGDHNLGKDVVSQFLEGWDWVIPIADRSTGICSDVILHRTGCVRLRDPFVVSSFSPSLLQALKASPGLPACGAGVGLVAGVQVVNCTDAAISITLSLQISHMDPDTGAEVLDLSAAQDVNLPAGAVVDFKFAEQALSQAELWWPVDMGSRTLYEVVIDATRSGAKTVEHEVSSTFGIRHLKSWVDDKTKGRKFQINGCPMFITGGNYIASDAMFRDSEHRVRDEVALLALAGLNMLRCWGGAGCQKSAFYEACDQHGVLVWVEFWITGDDDGRGAGDSQYPLDHALFLKCAEDVIRLTRARPSVALYVGGNEQQPCPELSQGLQGLVSRLDKERVYIVGSLWDGFADGKGGDGYLNLHDGPYDVQDPRSFFKPDYYAYGFNPEIGSVGVPELETLKRILPGSLCQVPKFTPVDSAPDALLQEFWTIGWSHHTYQPYGSPSKQVANQIAVYGVPQTMEEYCQQAQLANYIQYRSLVEGFLSKMWLKHTGFLIWKIQNPWYGLKGQLYDFDLYSNACLYGVRKATEPVHIQCSPLGDGQVQVVNRTPLQLKGTLEYIAKGLNGAVLLQGQVDIDIPPTTIVAAASLPAVKCEGKDVFFLQLILSFKAPSSMPDARQILLRGFQEQGLRNSLQCLDDNVVADDNTYIVDNVYWLTNNWFDINVVQPQDEFLTLKGWRSANPAKVAIKAEGKYFPDPGPGAGKLGHGSSWNLADCTWETGKEYKPYIAQVVFEIANADPNITAFFMRVSMELDEKGRKETVPALYVQDNYFTILPGYKRTLALQFRFEVVSGIDRGPQRRRCRLGASTAKVASLQGLPFKLVVCGYNLAATEVDIQWL